MAAISEKFLGVECGMVRKSSSITAPSCHDACLPPTRSCPGTGNTRYYAWDVADGYLVNVIVMSLSCRCFAFPCWSARRYTQSGQLSLQASGRRPWERTCSRRRCFRRRIFGGCTGPFANQFAPTGASTTAFPHWWNDDPTYRATLCVRSCHACSVVPMKFASSGVFGWANRSFGSPTSWTLP